VLPLSAAWCGRTATAQKTKAKAKILGKDRPKNIALLMMLLSYDALCFSVSGCLRPVLFSFPMAAFHGAIDSKRCTIRRLNCSSYNSGNFCKRRTRVRRSICSLALAERALAMQQSRTKKNAAFKPT